MYSDGTLCLHKSGDWTQYMFIADSTVPWAAEWLANYEIWLATGDWHGGGEWPPRRADSFKSGELITDLSERAA